MNGAEEALTQGEQFATTAFWVLVGLGVVLLIAIVLGTWLKWKRPQQLFGFLLVAVLAFAALLFVWQKGAFDAWWPGFLLVAGAAVLYLLLEKKWLWDLTCWSAAALFVIALGATLIWSTGLPEWMAGEKADHPLTAEGAEAMGETIGDEIAKRLMAESGPGTVSEKLAADILGKLPKVPISKTSMRNGWNVSISAPTTLENILPHLEHRNPDLCLHLAGGSVYRLRAIRDPSGHIEGVRWTTRILSGPSAGEVRNHLIPTDDLLGGSYRISPPVGEPGLIILWTEGGSGGLELLVERSGESRTSLLSDARYCDKGVLVTRM